MKKLNNEMVQFLLYRNFQIEKFQTQLWITESEPFKQIINKLIVMECYPTDLDKWANMKLTIMKELHIKELYELRSQLKLYRFLIDYQKKVNSFQNELYHSIMEKIIINNCQCKELIQQQVKIEIEKKIIEAINNDNI
ncbi:MAG: hypothetical protein WBO70_02045 [Erysipelotrichaceae bacterium]